MASSTGPAAHALAFKLQEEGPTYDFFSAVRRIECVNPDVPKVGTSQKPSEDPVRFCEEAYLAFPTCTIAKVTQDSLTNVPRMYVNFIGLLGPNGPLPLHITEYARERIFHHNDYTLTRFLDIFHHRITSLFYRAWAINQQVVSYEHLQYDRFAEYVASFFGDGMESFKNRDSVPDLSKLHYSGRLGGAARNAEGLEAILQDFFQIRTRVETFVGEWIELPPDSLCRLGEAPMTGTLGSTAIVGSRIWECQYKFRVILGPMGYDDYQRMLPGGDSLRRLRDWVKNYIGDELVWDLQLILKKEEVPAATLGKSGRLGWSTWTKAKPLPRDADNLILNPAQN
ncbi:MAG TPA: type VI secretion system baseplate subunit TssG [Phycisphaerae bacterium]|jgi:type VI secretion system protein ImpH